MIIWVMSLYVSYIMWNQQNFKNWWNRISFALILDLQLRTEAEAHLNQAIEAQYVSFEIFSCTILIKKVYMEYHIYFPTYHAIVSNEMINDPILLMKYLLYGNHSLNEC
jgi:hypothetical protein